MDRREGVLVYITLANERKYLVVYFFISFFRISFHRMLPCQNETFSTQKSKLSYINKLPAL